MGQEQEETGYVMAETILAGEQVEKLPLEELPAILAPVQTEFSGLPKNLLMRNGPADAGNGKTKH